MQEFMESSTNSSPVLMTGKLVGCNVRTSFIGQRKRITGLFRSIVDLKTNENEVFIDILCLDDLEEQKPITPSESELKRIREYISQVIYAFLVFNNGHKYQVPIWIQWP